LVRRLTERLLRKRFRSGAEVCTLLGMGAAERLIGGEQ
jgi:hypothetical protein